MGNDRIVTGARAVQGAREGQDLVGGAAGFGDARVGGTSEHCRQHQRDGNGREAGFHHHCRLLRFVRRFSAAHSIRRVRARGGSARCRGYSTRCDADHKKWFLDAFTAV